MNKFDKLLELLANTNEPQTLEKASKSLGIPYDLCQIISQFLTKYGFIQSKGNELRIAPNLSYFLAATFRNESEAKNLCVP